MSFSSADADGLIREIVENPYSDTPRLVFADWLDENQQIERAAFIRAQIKQTVLTTPGNVRTGLLQSEWKLGIEHRHEWVGSLSSLVDDWQFQRGFVVAIKIKAAAFLEHASNIFLAHPILHVALSNKRPRQTASGVIRWKPAIRSSAGKPFGIDPCLWDRLKQPVEGFATDREAQEALSVACVCWARSKAGLPEMVA